MIKPASHVNSHLSCVLPIINHKKGFRRPPEVAVDGFGIKGVDVNPYLGSRVSLSTVEVLPLLCCPMIMLRNSAALFTLYRSPGDL